MHKIQSLAGLFLLLVGGMSAQDTLERKKTSLSDAYHLRNSRQLWAHTSNAAALALDDASSLGQVSFELMQNEGSYHRAQEGQKQQAMRFSTDRSEQINERLHVWGSAKVNIEREHDRRFSDVFDTYRGNPFLYGSAVAGRYDKQFFDFSAKLAYRVRPSLRIGLSIDYLVGDQARIKDPRPRSSLADYAFKPSLVVKINENFFVGANANYHYRKEKLIGITTVQEDANFMYYTMVGMENGDESRQNPLLQNGMGILRGYTAFSRRFYSTLWGGDVQLGYQDEGLRMLLDLGWMAGKENTIGEKRKSPGEYWSRDMHAHYKFRYSRGRLLHSIDAGWKHSAGFSNEYVQHLEQRRDSSTSISSENWITDFVYTQQYQQNNAVLEIHYRQMALRRDQRSLSWQWGVSALRNHRQYVYHTPHSLLETSGLEACLHGLANLFAASKHQLLLHSQISYHHVTNHQLSLHNSSNDLATNIWIPDSEHLALFTAAARLGLTYTFVVNSGKYSLPFFLKGEGGYLFAVDDAKLRRTSFALSVGLLLN